MGKQQEVNWKATYIALAIVSIIILAISVPTAINKTSIKNWPTTEGIVINHQVMSQQGQNGIEFYPVIYYNYQVNGIDYQSTSITHSNERTVYSSEADANNSNVFRQYPINAQVLVHYDPANPDKSALEVGTGMFNLFFIYWFTFSKYKNQARNQQSYK